MQALISFYSVFYLTIRVITSINYGCYQFLKANCPSVLSMNMLKKIFTCVSRAVEGEDDDTKDDLAIPEVSSTQKNEEMHSAVSARQNASVLQFMRLLIWKLFKEYDVCWFMSFFMFAFQQANSFCNYKISFIGQTHLQDNILKKDVMTWCCSEFMIVSMDKQM